jgi:hypothetical protein
MYKVPHRRLLGRQFCNRNTVISWIIILVVLKLQDTYKTDKFEEDIEFIKKESIFLAIIIMYYVDYFCALLTLENVVAPTFLQPYGAPQPFLFLFLLQFTIVESLMAIVSL